VKPGHNYVCLSDLHLGAKYSILSARDNDNKFQANSLSNCLKLLGAGLQSYVAKVFGDTEEEKPKLILLGDLLDYSFGSMTDIVKSLEPFIEAFFPEDKSQRCFADDIILIPGNHDHRLWQNVKDGQFLDNYYQERVFNSEIRYQSTPIFHNESIGSDFLQNIPVVKSRGLQFNLRYPNWGFYLPGQNGSISRQILLHHGHYVEPLYRLMTVINQLISDIGDPDIEELERQNGGWVDFFWSSLGASPVQRDNAVLLFDIMQNPAATHKYSQQVAQLIADYLSLHRGVSPGTKVYSGITLQRLIASLLDASIGKMFQAERAAYHHALSNEGLAGLRWYLGKPLLQQLESETGTSVCADSSFVFGHTHKPFQQAIVVSEFPAPVKVYNSGGWVVDQTSFNGIQGGAAVFIDKDLNLANLRLYQTPLNNHMPPVVAEAVQTTADNPLLKKMQSALDAQPSRWQDFQTEVKLQVDRRAAEARERFFDPASSKGVK
jgi:UDP-2,3-diacylglucosamine pyrophosphatase LpxH